MADTIGIGHAATARATLSRLKAPEVFERTAAARSSTRPVRRRVRPANRASAVERVAESVFSASLPCTATSSNVTRNVGTTASQHRNDVAQRRAGARTDHRDVRRKVAATARLRVSANKPSSLSLRFSASNAARSAPSPESFEMIGEQLKIAARFIEADATAQDHLHAVAWFEANDAIAIGEHRAAQLRLRRPSA